MNIIRHGLLPIRLSEMNMTVSTRGYLKTVLKIVVIAVIAIALLFAAAMTVLRIKNRDFYDAAYKEFEIPGLGNRFVPQGLDFCEEQGIFLISGYDSRDSRAVVYACGRDGKYREFALTDTSGGTLFCHSGGIAHTEKYVYVVGGERCYVFPIDGFFSEENSDIAAVKSFDTFNRASFCHADEKYLYIGEYYYPIGYQTDNSHHITTPSGDNNKAVVMAFALSGSSAVGVNTAPSFALSTTERIQGMCIDKVGRLFLSASSAFRGSQIYVYDYSAAKENVGSFSYKNGEMPIYYLDSGNLISSTEILPKSEGIITLGDRLYMLFEAASSKFLYGRLLDCQYVYSAPTDYFISGGESRQTAKNPHFSSKVLDKFFTA